MKYILMACGTLICAEDSEVEDAKKVFKVLHHSLAAVMNVEESYGIPLPGWTLSSYLWQFYFEFFSNVRIKDKPFRLRRELKDQKVTIRKKVYREVPECVFVEFFSFLESKISPTDNSSLIVLGKMRDAYKNGELS